MSDLFGIKEGDVKAAEAETVRKLAADRAAELENLSPDLRTYASGNPDADIVLLKMMDEQRVRSDLAAQETRQQMNELREQLAQVRQRPPIISLNP